MPALFLVLDGKRIEIAKVPFVIGRTSTCDLVIRDRLIRVSTRA